MSCSIGEKVDVLIWIFLKDDMYTEYYSSVLPLYKTKSLPTSNAQLPARHSDLVRHRFNSIRQTGSFRWGYNVSVCGAEMNPMTCSCFTVDCLARDKLSF